MSPPASPPTTSRRSPSVAGSRPRGVGQVPGVGGGTEDRGRAELVPQVEDPFGLAHAYRHHRGARSLDRQMVRETADVQGIVHAVQHDVIWADASCEVSPGANL